VNYIDTIILGLVQGFTEFIPISSSGHLVISQIFLSGASDHLLLEYVNIGTLLALLIYFRSKIADIIKDVAIKKNYRLLINIIITTLPAAIVGFLLASFIAKSWFFSSLLVVAVTLGLVGVLMIVLEKIPRLGEVSDINYLSKKKALAIGIAQMAALVPGVSRSGATMIAGRLSGFPIKLAAEYSFLVSIPLMLGVSLKLIVSDGVYLEQNIYTILLCNIAAFVAGLIAIKYLLKYLSSHSLAVFGWYRVILSIGLICYILLQ